MSNFKFLPYHLVEKSYWPICVSMVVFSFLSNFVFWWHFGFDYIIMFYLFLILLGSFLWWLDVSKESYKGNHKYSVILGLRFGMILFMLSEVFFFVTFFWGYFHNCWGLSFDCGWEWPPSDFIEIIVDPFSVPFLNTLMLLSSGVTMTWAHHSFLDQNYNNCRMGLLLTMFLGFYFLFLQFLEYGCSKMSINCLSYGSMFFLLTGFHGTHVTMGAIFLTMCFFRILYNDLKSEVHVGFECAAWYWHFVDVVWMFLFFFVYWYSFV